MSTHQRRIEMSTPISSTLASPALKVIAELAEEFEKVVQELPARAPEDGVDPAQARATGPASDGEKVAAKEPAVDLTGRSDKETKAALAELNKHNALELQRKVRAGTIPSEILENPIAMNEMVQRIQDFSRMIQMITNMMQVEHETLTAIIRNIKA
jgi:hypothetical protein